MYLQLNKILPLLCLSISLLAADTSPQLTDAQKYQAMRLYTESAQLQEAQKKIQDSSKNLQSQFEALSSACGKNFTLAFVPDSQGVIEPVCKPNAETPKGVK